MLDKRAEKILLFLNSACEDGVYKIFTKEELLVALPSRFKTDTEGLGDDIKYLEDHQYIKCKYKDDEQFCLTPLNKGRLYKEVSEEKKKETKSYKMFVILAFIGGVVGGLVGGAVSGLILSLFKNLIG